MAALTGATALAMPVYMNFHEQDRYSSVTLSEAKGLPAAIEMLSEAKHDMSGFDRETS